MAILEDMEQLIAYSDISGFDRKLFSLSLESLSSFPHHLNLPSLTFAMLLVCDARQATDSEIQQFGDLLITQGLAYLCTWGPDCERVHDLVDIAIGKREEKEEQEFPVMTTWHKKDSLDDALWFMLEVAYPDEAYADSCGSSPVVSVDNLEWDQHIRNRLMNLKELSLDVLRNEKNRPA